MARRSRSAPPSKKELRGAIHHESPAELGRLQHASAEGHDRSGKQAEDEAALLQATRACLPAPEMRRLKRLIGKSERGTLSPKELVEYQALAQRTLEIDVVRVEALAELVRRRGKPVEVVQKEIGWQGGGMDGA
jgi:hypothetical protein